MLPSFSIDFERAALIFFRAVFLLKGDILLEGFEWDANEAPYRKMSMGRQMGRKGFHNSSAVFSNGLEHE